jgi:hypothetical protein
MVEVSPEPTKAGLPGSLRRDPDELPVTIGGAPEIGLTRGPDLEVEV